MKTTDHLSATSLSAEINAAHTAACRAAGEALNHARRAGELLQQAKAAVNHGEWLPWLAANCPAISERTAQGYMRVAREWPALQAKAQHVADLPLRQALALLSEPSERADETTNRSPLQRLIDASKDGSDDAELAQARAELSVLERTLKLPDLTVDELAAIARRGQELLDKAHVINIRSLSALGEILNTANAQGLGELWLFLAEHPELQPATAPPAIETLDIPTRTLMRTTVRRDGGTLEAIIAPSTLEDYAYVTVMFNHDAGGADVQGFPRPVRIKDIERTLEHLNFPWRTASWERCESEAWSSNWYLSEPTQGLTA